MLGPIIHHNITYVLLLVLPAPVSVAVYSACVVALQCLHLRERMSATFKMNSPLTETLAGGEGRLGKRRDRNAVLDARRDSVSDTLARRVNPRLEEAIYLSIL